MKLDTANPDAGIDPFIQQVQLALEHFNDPRWLADESPLAAPYLMAGFVVSKEDRDFGMACVQALQRQISLAVENIAVKDASFDPAILLRRTYLQPKPYLKREGVAVDLGLSRATYFRYRAESVRLLALELLTTLKPSLRSEQPLFLDDAAILPSRVRVAEAVLADLSAGRSAHLTGGAGMGKTSVAGWVTQRWAVRPVFWFTFRPGTADSLQTLIFALGQYLHRHKQPALWAQLLSQTVRVTSDLALGFIREGLTKMGADRPLLCFDNLDVFSAEPQAPSTQSGDVLGFISALAADPAGAALLLVGRRPMATTNATHHLGPVSYEETAALLSRSGMVAERGDIQRFIQTGGSSPLMLGLLAASAGRAAPGMGSLRSPLAGLSPELLVDRLLRDLAPDELDALEQLSIFNSIAPADVFPAHAEAIHTLVERGIALLDGAGGAGLPRVLQDMVRAKLGPEQRQRLNLIAGDALLERGQITAAAQHYLLAGRADVAVWVWHNQRAQEIAAGQAETALAMFRTIKPESLSNEDDRRALALVLAELHMNAGDAERGLSDIQQAKWPSAGMATYRAERLQGDLLTRMGQMDQAVETFRAGLNTLNSLPDVLVAGTRSRAGRVQLFYGRRFEDARREAMTAQAVLSNLLGEIEDETGSPARAREHFLVALEHARAAGAAQEIAVALQNLGLHEARLEQLDDALEHFGEAITHFEEAGNIVCSVGTKTNISYAYLCARQYQKAVLPSSEAMAYFERVRHPYWLALNAANLAEAHVNLGNLREAEQFVWQTLKLEEVSSRPYALTTLGQIYRLRHQYEEAERNGRLAIEMAEANSDRWAEGAAWRVLGETYASQSKTDDAASCAEIAIGIFRSLGAENEARRTREPHF